MTFNQLATLIAEEEGLKDKSSIGNVREQLRIFLTRASKMPAGELGGLLAKYTNK